MRASTCGMEQIISIFMVEAKEIIHFGTVEYLITLNMKFLDFYFRTFASGFKSTIVMDFALME